MKRLKISFDVDGVLLSCVEYGIECANKEKKINPPLRLEEFDHYDCDDERTGILVEYYNRPDFVQSQPAYEGAQELIHWVVSQGHEVFFVTAVPPQCMSARATQLVKLFPEVPATHIIMATRKDLVRTDVHIDDAPHNIQRSKAHYPVLFRQNWNKSVDGVLSVNDYEQLKLLIRQIAGSIGKKKTKPSIVCLVGPTGAGKKEIQSCMVKNPVFQAPVCFTTRPKEKGQPSLYKHITQEAFDGLLYRGELLEYASYGGYWYGLTENAIEGILEKGKTVVTVVDMVGANALRAAYPDKVLTVFVRKDKGDAIQDILERKISAEDKVQRIVSLENEFRNEDLCDQVILNTDSPEAAAQTLMRQISG